MIRLEHSGGSNIRIVAAGEILAEIADVAFPAEGVWMNSEGGSLVQSPWTIAIPDPTHPTDGVAVGNRYRCTYSLRDREILDAAVDVDPKNSSGRFSLRTRVSLQGLRVGDSFETLTLHAPRFSVSRNARFFLTTLGLGDSASDSTGGYWPKAVFGKNLEALPRKAFAPFVVLGSNAALAIAPGSHFLSSALTSCDNGVLRGLHGGVDRLEAGDEIITRFATGSTLSKALLNLGEALLRDGSKARPRPEQSLVTSHLSWWNAYGGYYTEPLRALNEDQLRQVIASFDEQDIPVRSLGLDLWYPFRAIGQAIRFAPDKDKYPSGLRGMSDRFRLPLTLHISALAEKNEYGVPGHDASHYETVADDLHREGAIVAWHDWMRTQQHLSRELRHDPSKASAWYEGMTSAFSSAGIGVLQCMQTMGMALASTAAEGVFGSRTSLDYLFSQEEAMASLEKVGLGSFRIEQVEPLELRRQNLLMGMVLHAIGLLPFYDLFLTSHHPGLGGGEPLLEAALRTLSCGPVGIGDAPGMTDSRLVRRMCLSDGRLLHPDHPPLLAPQSVPDEIEVFTTSHRAADAMWVYILALNLTDRPQEVSLSPFAQGEVVAFDVICQRPTPMTLTVPPRSLVYRMLAPVISGMAVYGLWTPLVPAARGILQSVTGGDAGEPMSIDVRDAEGEIAVWESDPVVAWLDGQRASVRSDTECQRIQLSGHHKRIVIQRR